MKLWLRSVGRVIDASRQRSRFRVKSSPARPYGSIIGSRRSGVALQTGNRCSSWPAVELRLGNVLVQQIRRRKPLRQCQSRGQTGGASARWLCVRQSSRSVCPQLQLNNKDLGSVGARRRRGSGGHQRAEQRGRAAANRPKPGRSLRVLMHRRLRRRSSEKPRKNVSHVTQEIHRCKNEVHHSMEMELHAPPPHQWEKKAMSWQFVRQLRSSSRCRSCRNKRTAAVREPMASPGWPTGCT